MSRMTKLFGLICLITAITLPISVQAGQSNLTQRVTQWLGLTGPELPGKDELPDKWNCNLAKGVVRLKGVDLCHVVGDAQIKRPREKGTLRYRVLVEKGLEDQTDGFVAGVSKILNGEKGWIRNGIRFERVVRGFDLTVLLASPASVDRLCQPLKTKSWLSCAIFGRAIINARRWREGAETWGDDIDGYHYYLINHEVGHVLGLRHAECPEEGQPAPIMLPQTRFLKGCTANGAATPIDIAMMKRALPYMKRRLLGIWPKRRSKRRRTRRSRRYRRRTRVAQRSSRRRKRSRRKRRRRRR